MERPSTLAIFSLIIALLLLVLIVMAGNSTSRDPGIWVILGLWGIASAIIGGIAFMRAHQLKLGGGKVAMVSVIIGVIGWLVSALGFVSSLSAGM